MKKYNYLLLLSAVTASSLALTSCDEEKLDIPQKGVAPVESFYKTDADAESALVTVYSDTFDNFAFMADVTGYNYSPYYALTNWMADDIYMSGSGEGDCEPERQYHDFRYHTDLNIVLAGYTMIYRSIHKCNLLINNVADDSPVKKRCIAEAKVMRAFDHMLAAIYWGTPPIVTEVLGGEAQPENAESQAAVFDFVVKEIDDAIAMGLPKRNGPNDKEGAYKITEDFAKAVKGKALLWKGDYAGAKTALKQVITSGNYELLPSEDMKKIGHNTGKGSSEIVFEFNVVGGDQVNNLGNRQMGNIPYLLNWRFEFLNGGPKANAEIALNADGWGWENPSKEFAEALIENDGMESARRKAWIITYDEMLYNLPWKSDGDNFTPGKTAAKAADKERGVGGMGYYGNAGYFCWKTVMHEPGDNLGLNWCGTWNRNFTIMRYAEVLLMYAEACAQTGDNDGLQYLNAIQKRAQSKHISTSLTLDEVKKEKRLECWLEGCRAADLIRWGDVSTLQTADHVVYILTDAINTGAAEHKGIVSVDGNSTFKGKGAGFVPGKHNLLPFPQTVVDLNKSLKQNPGWE